MEYILKQKKAAVEAEAERLFGNDTVLKTAYVLTETETPQDEIEEVAQYLRKQASDLAAEVESKMLYTYDLGGNLVPIHPEKETEKETEKEDGIEIKISD
jgi:hypothetical protein